MLGASEELKMRKILLPLPKQEREVRVRLDKVSLWQVLKRDSERSSRGCDSAVCEIWPHNVTDIGIIAKCEDK